MVRFAVRSCGNGSRSREGAVGDGCDLESDDERGPLGGLLTRWAVPAGSSVSNFVATGDLITDSFGYMNDKRAQLGLPALAYNGQVAQAASNHAAYMQLNTIAKAMLR